MNRQAEGEKNRRQVRWRASAQVVAGEVWQVAFA